MQFTEIWVNEIMHLNTPANLFAYPAWARRVASTAPSSSFRNRVCTFPRKFTTLRVGFWAKICACRRREALPITEPSGKSLMLLTAGSAEMNTSRVSSRGKVQGSTVPGTSQVGTSFMECTQMSTSLDSSATSSSFVNKPLPPISFNA